MGRSAAKVEGYEDTLSAVARAVSTLQVFEGHYASQSRSSRCSAGGEAEPVRCGVCVGEVSHVPDHGAKPLKASRLQFPGKPEFDPRRYFDGSTKKLYEFPLDLGKPLQEVGKPPPVQVRASPQGKLQLFKKLADSGLLQPVPEGTYLDGYRNGLFAVPKDASRDRMVLDGRPANMVDRGQQRWSQSMANAAALSGIYIHPELNLVASGEDLKDCFYQFKVNAQRTARNVLHGSLSLAEAKEVFGENFCWPTSRVAVGLSSLAMGDTCAVEFAQCSHIGLMLQHGVATADEIITMHGSVPRGLLQVGVIVDDLVILEQVLKAEFVADGRFEGNWESGDRISRAQTAYAEAGLKNNPKKGFLGETCSSFWGIDLDGEKGLLRASQKRLWPTMVITLRVCSLGLATVGLLESLAGMQVSLLGVRRRLYSLMDVVFEPLMMNCKSSTVLRLSEDLIAELTSIAILGTLAVVNLRAPFGSFVSATDASRKVIAAVRAPLPSRAVAELSRHTLRKGIWARLLPPGRALLREHGLLDVDDEVPDEKYRTHPLWETLARSLVYSESWRRLIRAEQHINVSELQAYVLEEKRVANATPSLRYLSGADSQVALGAVVKGRAASPKLNRVLQTTMPYAIGGDAYTLPMYYNTASNRADDPTRGSSPSPPDLEEPPWLRQLANGDCAAFDRWLAKVGAPTPTAPLPFDDISGSDQLDLQSMAAMKSKNWRAKRVMVSSGASGQVETKDAAAKSRPVRVRNVSNELPSDRTSELHLTGGITLEGVQLLESLPRRQFFFSSGVEAFHAPGALDLFSGTYGVAKQLLNFGAPWVLTFEWNRSSDENLLDENVRNVIRKMFLFGCFLAMCAAPICASFSVAVTPPVRSSRFPRGIPGLRISMREKVAEGNSHNDFVFELVVTCEDEGNAYAVENPDTSWWWRQKKWRRWRHSGSDKLFRCCFCRFGTAWRKGTRVATNTRLAGVRMMCTCKKPHVQLRGGHPTKKIPWTAVAQPYPWGFARLLALALCQKAGWCRTERLDVAGCSKSGSLRVGEADHPGPNRRKAPIRVGRLGEVQLVTAQTLALEAKQLEKFQRWCRETITNVDLSELFSAVPQFLVEALKTHAEWLFQNGGALSNLRHLLLAAQRWVPSARVFMAPAWEMVEKWESLCPVKHRTPVPETLVCAMCVLAWHMQWWSWVGATVLSFYGAGRLGEVLRCSREDLVLPGDVFEATGSPVFLRLRSFKSQMRQPARVQHMKVSNTSASRILTKIFGQLPLDAPLFNASAYQYRKRWNLLLEMLRIPKELGLTPGGLRGGAAVYHYKNGRPIADLMWLLRLRSQTTLESYLQEVGALNVFATLSAETRASVRSTAASFAFLDAGETRSAGK